MAGSDRLADKPFTALVLAGTRPGGDPFAREMAVPYKALVRIGGRAMLARVIEALRASPSIGPIYVCGMADEAFAADAELAQLRERGEFEVLTGAATPANSILAALDSGRCATPLLVTTGDHALLTAAMVEAVCRSPRAAHADLIAGVVDERVVRHRYPDVKRTFTRFRDGSYKGTNLFALLTPESRRGPQLWVQVEQNRKHPWRMVSLLGPLVLLRFLLRRLTLAEAIERVATRMALRVALEPVAIAEAALDVDSQAHRAVAEAAIAARAAGLAS